MAAKGAAKKIWSLISEEKLRLIYTSMLRYRLLQERLRKQSRSRRSHADTSLCAGPEAILAGTAIDLRPTDAIALLQGNAAAAWIQGVPLQTVLTHADTNTPSQNFAHNFLPTASSPAALLHLCLGFAWAHAQQKDSAVVVAYLNESSTPVAVLQEALRTASAHKLPVLFVCTIEESAAPSQSSSRKKLTALHTQAQICGVPGIPVDGADAVAIYRVSFEALQRARNGGGPTLIEAKLLRDKTAAHAFADPIATMERYMEQRGIFDVKWKQKTAAAFAKELDKAVASVAARGRKSSRQKRNR